MKIARLLRRLLGDRRGAQTLEMVFVSAIYFPLTFAIVEVGFILWTQNAMQSAATVAARCGAIGASECTDLATYAAAAVGEWLVPDSITAAEVTVSTAASCNAAVGKATIVTITHQFWSGVTLPWPFAQPSISVSACFPSASS